MQPTSISPGSSVSLVTSEARVTPTPPRASRFGEVLSSTLVRSAESAASVLPGSPMMAYALRSGSAPSAAPNLQRSPSGPVALGMSQETIAPAAGGIEGSLQQSQDMNLYYLQVQESVNSQNRTFTALSNVLKAQHDTVKTAIGNIR